MTDVAYAARARIDRAEPRFRATRAAAPPVRSALRDTGPTGDRIVDLAGEPYGAGLAARWEAIREAWGQTVFFLTDPNSWR